MRARHWLLAVAAFVLGGFALGWLLAPSSTGQPAAAPAKPEARYQTVGVGNYVVVSDPATGECWARQVQEPQIKDAPDRAWVPLGSPVKKK